SLPPARRPLLPYSTRFRSDAASTSGAVTQTVNAAATSTGLTSSPNPSTFGQSVALTATVSPSAATGTVTFKDGSTSLGTGTLSRSKAHTTELKSHLSRLCR